MTGRVADGWSAEPRPTISKRATGRGGASLSATNMSGRPPATESSVPALRGMEPSREASAGSIAIVIPCPRIGSAPVAPTTSMRSTRTAPHVTGTIPFGRRGRVDVPVLKRPTT